MNLKLNALRGVELVDGVTRLCAMNLLLHGIGPTSAGQNRRQPKHRFQRRLQCHVDQSAVRQEVSPDLFWIKDESLEGSENLPEPDTRAEEITEDLRAGLAQFEEIQGELAAR